MNFRPISFFVAVAIALTTSVAWGASPSVEDRPDRTDVFFFSKGLAGGEATIRLPYEFLVTLSDSRVIARIQQLVDHQGMQMLAVMFQQLSPAKRQLTFGFGPRPGAPGTGHARFKAIAVRSATDGVVVESVSEPELLGVEGPRPRPSRR